MEYETMARAGQTNPEAQEVYDAQVGMRDILMDLVPEDYLPEVLKRLDRLIDAKIRHNTNPRY